MIKHIKNSHSNYIFVGKYQQFYYLKHQQKAFLLVLINYVDTKLIYHMPN